MQKGYRSLQSNKKLLQGVQMLHGTVFSKRIPLAAGGKVFLGHLGKLDFHYIDDGF
jgi:hypothetical protein